MKCPFCQQEMIKRSDEEFSSGSVPVSIIVWQCDAHAPVIFRRASMSTGLTCNGSIFVPLGDRWFRIILDDEKIWIEELKEEEGNPTSFALKRVIATNVSPKWKITPDNAINKLQTYLVFM